MSETTQSKKDFPHLKTVERISRIPVVYSGYHYATDLYQRIKNVNGLVTWSLNSAEASVMLAVEITLPAVLLFETPIHTVDNILCKSLEVVEKRVPIINVPPYEVFSKTKNYVSTKVVQPVLRRADSVKQISIQNASKYGNMAAIRLDNALDVADKYVDKYLPDVSDNPSDVVDSTGEGEPASRTSQTIQHVNRFSRKLQRRLTRRTIAEAKALKQQSADTLQCLIYLADLLARDPKAFMEKARKMWETLSGDEPENQVPPANLEQLISMITREVARRIVHLVNYTGSTIKNMPHRIGNTIQHAAHNINSVTDYVLRKVHLEGMKMAAVAQARLQINQAVDVIVQIKVLGLQLLDNIFSRIYNSQNRSLGHSHEPKKKLSPLQEVKSSSNNSSSSVSPKSSPHSQRSATQSLNDLTAKSPEKSPDKSEKSAGGSPISNKSEDENKQFLKEEKNHIDNNTETKSS